MNKRGKPHQSTGVWADRVNAAGSKAALARYLCVSPSSLYRYEMGQMEMGPAVTKLLHMFDKEHHINARH